MKTPLKQIILTVVLLLFATLFPGRANSADSGWIVSCNYSHSLADDPIVYPNQPGASHLHDFVGATTTNADSTGDTLLAGGTTCLVAGDKSAYWVPALYKDGVRLLPQGTAKHALFYYRRKGAPAGTTITPFPLGLKMIVGNAHAQSPADNPQLGTQIIFKCGPGSSTDLAAPPAQCSSGVMVISLIFPNCWNGVDLDSPDHKSHMAYPIGSSCPASHPVVLPRIESFFRYRVGTGPIGTITLASGDYYTIHQDFFNGWEPALLQELVDNCLTQPTDCGTNPP